MKKYLIFIFTLLFTFSCNSPEKERQAELQLLESSIDVFNTAFQEGDLTTLDSLTTDNYIHTNGSDRAFSKEQSSSSPWVVMEH